MNRIDAFQSILDGLLTKYVVYDEYILRLHLLAYSVWDQILKTKLCWLLLKNIEWGYSGLIRFELLNRLLADDPYHLRRCSEDEYDELKAFVALQVAEFVSLAKPKSTKFSSIFHLLQEVSSTDSEAIRLEVNDSFEESFSIDFKAISDETYCILAEYLIDDFYQGSQHYPTDELVKLLVDNTDLTGVYTIFNLNSGIGAIALEIARRFPDDQFPVDADVQNICEQFLCDINLWTVAPIMGEPFASQRDRFIETQENYFDSKYHKYSNDDLYDLSIGILPTSVASDIENLDYSFYRLSSSSKNSENAYVELMLSLISENGKAVVVVPNRFLISTDSRLLREFYLSSDWIVSITNIPHVDSLESSDGMSIIAFNRNKPTDQQGKVTFKGGGKVIQSAMDAIRSENSDLELCPSRFLQSIEYEYRDILVLFDNQRFPKSLRPKFINIVKKINHESIELENFTQIRMMIEALFEAIKRKNASRLPNSVFKLREGRITACCLYLKGDADFKKPARWPNRPTPLFPKHIGEFVTNCIALGNIGAHGGKQDLTIYEYRSAVNSLLAILKWFKQNYQNI